MSFLYLHKVRVSILVILSMSFWLQSCETKTVHRSGQDEVNSANTSIVKPSNGVLENSNPTTVIGEGAPNSGLNGQTNTANSPSVPPSSIVKSKLPKAPKLGVILGAGGLKTFAHIGFLQQLNQFKISINGIVGIEMAAPIAALYAQKEAANQVEWQMFKMKEEDILSKNFLNDGYKTIDFSHFNEFLNSVFVHLKSESLRIHFACPAFNLAKGANFLMTKGDVSQLLELCTPYPPLFRPFKRNMAGIRELKSAADFLKSKGANFILLVNVLDNPANQSLLGKNSNEDLVALLWSEIASIYTKSNQIGGLGIDFVLNIPTPEYSLVNFAARRELIQRGVQISEKAVAELSKKLGL